MKRINIGLPSMVVIFVSISMMSLSMLGYLSAKQSLATTQKNVEAMNEYYDLSNQAYRYLETLNQDDATFTIKGSSQSLTVEVQNQKITKWQITNNEAWQDESKYPIYQEVTP